MISVKTLCVVTLCLQVTVSSLLVRYSKSVLKEEYINEAALLIVESLKFLIACVFIYKNFRAQRSLEKQINIPSENSCRLLFKKLVQRSPIMLLPALIYFIQNNLTFVALENLSAGSFTIMNQLKILTTALFSVLMLGKSLSTPKWRALFLLILGAVLVQYKNMTSDDANASPHPNSEYKEYSPETYRSATGIGAVLLSVSLSGFSGIYFEWVLKKQPVEGERPSIWELNFQLSLYGIALAITRCLTSHYDFVLEKGLFHGFSFVTVLICLSNAFGGILVALTVKHADTIVKGFATSGAIILSSLFGFLLLGDHLDTIFCIGACVVVISIMNYQEIGNKSNAYYPVDDSAPQKARKSCADMQEVIVRK